MGFSLMRTAAAVLSAGLLLSACASGARSDFGLNALSGGGANSLDFNQASMQAVYDLGEALGRSGEAWK